MILKRGSQERKISESSLKLTNLQADREEGRREEGREREGEWTLRWDMKETLWLQTGYIGKDNKEYHEQLYGGKFTSVDHLDSFLKNHKL